MGKPTTEKLDIKLKYTGQDVEDGSMSVEDFVEAVQGFSSAYGRISTSSSLSQKHRIRITGIEKGSVDILLTVKQVVDIASQNSDGIQTLVIAGGALGGIGMGIVKTIGWLVKFVKHVKKKPYTTKVKDGGTVIIQNYENTVLEMPVNIFNIYKNNEGGIKSDLYKITKPLEEGKIEEAEIQASSEKETYAEKITYNDKPYFDPKDEDLTETDKVWIQGSFNSLTKSTNKGYFYLSDGSRVSYEFKNENPENLHKYFLHKGLVKVQAIVHLDQNLKPSKLDIFSVKKLQIEMDFISQGKDVL